MDGQPARLSARGGSASKAAADEFSHALDERMPLYCLTVLEELASRRLWFHRIAQETEKVAKIIAELARDQITGAKQG